MAWPDAPKRDDLYYQVFHSIHPRLNDPAVAAEIAGLGVYLGVSFPTAQRHWVRSFATRIVQFNLELSGNPLPVRGCGHPEIVWGLSNGKPDELWGDVPEGHALIDPTEPCHLCVRGDLPFDDVEVPDESPAYHRSVPAARRTTAPSPLKTKREAALEHQLAEARDALAAERLFREDLILTGEL